MHLRRWEYKPEPGWLMHLDSFPGLDEVVRRQLVYDILVHLQPFDWPPVIAERISQLRMVVDYVGKPPITSGQMEVCDRNMARLAGFAQIFWKVLGMGTEANW